MILMMIADDELRRRVFAAADDLLRAGDSVTVARVRQVVRADQNAVGPLIREWKNHQRSSATTINDVPEDAQRVLRMLWNTASELAASDYAAHTAEHQAHLAAAQAEREELHTAHTQAEIEITRQRRHIQSLTEELALVREELSAEKARREMTQRALDQAQEALTEERARISSLIADLRPAAPTSG